MPPPPGRRGTGRAAASPAARQLGDDYQQQRSDLGDLVADQIIPLVQAERLRGVSVSELARTFGVARRTVHDWTAGRSTHGRTVGRIPRYPDDRS